MSATIFLNGNWFSPDDATVSAMDAGLQHGVGLFETMLGGVTSGGEARVIRLGDHAARLDSSARELRLSDSLRTGALGDAVLETVRRSGLSRARIRLTITGGRMDLLGSAKQQGGAGRDHRSDATVLIVAQPATVYPGEMFDRGVLVTIADARANPLMPDDGHKTLNYWWRLRELQTAAAKGAGEALVFQVTNHVCGGCVSNVFAVKDGRLITALARGEEADGERPPSTGRDAGGATLPSPVLPGITRGVILEIADDASVSVERRLMTIDDLLSADEVFLTNSSWGVLPVVQIERKQIGDGKVGELTRRLVESYGDVVSRELTL